MSLVDVPDGQLAAIVTYLQMRDRPAIEIPPSPLRLDRVPLDPAAYRELFALVGAPWLWFSRLIMEDSSLTAVLDDPAVELFEVRDGEAVVGMLELDSREEGACELSFVGLVREYSGRGHGRWLLAEALSRAWSRPGVTRVHVHTCTLDHPAALAAYRRAGFIAVDRKIETFIDPRLAGILPLDTAPQVPLVGSPSS
ncbi:MAG: GNAT family N-acetyltransferase [Pseudomonadota bacterium]|nr:GNAT family N-acetyltransferase [Pseudomonadota bacterium]